MDRAAIQDCIPHRAPFLWLDEVVEISESGIHARKHVPTDLDVFRGHYPGTPILPGVLICESAFQAAAVLISRIAPVQEGHVPVVTRLTNTKFRRVVRPGETLDIQVELVERLSNAYFLTGKVSVDGQVAVRLEFACSEAPAPEA